MKKSLFGLTLALAGVMGTLPVPTQAGGIMACSEATPDLSQDSLLISGNFKYCKNPSAWLGQENGSYTKLVATLIDNNTVRATLTDTAVMVGSTQNVVVKCGWSARCEIDVAFVEEGEDGEEGPPAPVAKTGQTFCTYEDSGSWVQDDECSQASRPAGQDGEVQAGATTTPRFTDHGDGTVTDNLTGLIWLKNANCPNATRTWTTALSDVVQLNTSGEMNSNDCDDDSNGGNHQTDWRLPNIRELHSLVDFGHYFPPLPSGHPFSGVQSSNYYWSSTSLAGATNNAWILYLGSGIVNVDEKLGGFYVWPVRGGQ